MAGSLRHAAILPLALARVQRDAAPMRIDVVLYPGFDELDALGPFEVLSNAALADPAARVELVALTGAGAVAGSHGAEVRAARALAAPGETDLVVVPGGGWNDRSTAGAWSQVQEGALPRALAALHGAGATIASVCTGGMILAAAGLLDARPATTHHRALDELRAAGADVVDARVVDDGDIVTCGGVTSGLDLALHLAERLFGERVAAIVAREMEHERVGEVHRRPGGARLAV
jgi:transcriptional regulator GlxA family with amidase domain